MFITDKCSNLFWNMFYSKRIKISNNIILYVQSNPMSSNIRVLIKIYYICSILYFIRQIITWVHINKPRFILMLPFYFNICQWMNREKKSDFFLSRIRPKTSTYNSMTMSFSSSIYSSTLSLRLCLFANALGYCSFNC